VLISKIGKILKKIRTFAARERERERDTLLMNGEEEIRRSGDESLRHKELD
jgi:hypothetical protein